MRQRLISLDNVTVDFDGKRVLGDVSLDVYAGDFIAVTGPNGGGKTTLLRVMLKLLRPDSGRVAYYSPATGQPTSRLPIGYLPQKSNVDLKFPVTVGEVVKSGLLTGWWGGYGADGERKFRETARMVGIEEYLDQRIGTLSGGQLQRTLLGRALISDPKVLVLDEPLSYVDKQFEHRIYSMMEDLKRRMTIILVSHELSVISGMATRHILVDHRVEECHSPHHQRIDQCDMPE